MCSLENQWSIESIDEFAKYTSKSLRITVTITNSKLNEAEITINTKLANQS